MKQFFPEKTLALAISLLLFSGCSNQSNQISKTQNTYNSAQQYILANTKNTKSDVIPMETVESEKDVKQELDVLSQTGFWQIPHLSQNQFLQDSSSLYDFPIIINKQVEAYLDLFQGKQRRSFSRFLSRSGRYINMIEEEFVNSGLPKDLAYLALVESGFNPRARSYASAVGLWQFMSGTGKEYNLKINRYVDERCNVEKSTKAAANYLGDLYRDFGDWYLAVAAYNGGPGRVRKGMRKYNVDNFWDLATTKHLHMETVRYVPKLLATIIIAKNPKKYGFTDLQFEEPLEYDTLSVGPSLGLQAVALIAESDKDEIIQLNPELQRKTTPTNQAQYTIKIPKGKKILAQNNMKRLHRVASTEFTTHKISKNDTLAKICSKYNINTTTLLKINHLPNGKLINGKTLRIPYSTVVYKLLPKGINDVMLASKDDLILHKIKKGDTLSAIARHYHVPVHLIAEWNGIKNAKTIRAGQQLALFIDKTGQDIYSAPKKDTVLLTKNTKNIKNRVTKEQDSHSPVIIVASQKKIFHPTSPQIAQKPAEPSTHYYNIQSGDSLWKISRKFNVSMVEIKKLNKLTTNRLQPGRTLKIKKI